MEAMSDKVGVIRYEYQKTCRFMQTQAAANSTP